MNKLVLQPNGKYARWSDEAKHFTHFSLIYPFAAFMDELTNDWDKCLDILEVNHGIYERERAERFGNE